MFTNQLLEYKVNAQLTCLCDVHLSVYLLTCHICHYSYSYAQMFYKAE